MSQPRLQPAAAARIYRILAHLAAIEGQIGAPERAALGEWRVRLGLDADAAGALEGGGRDEDLRVGDDPREHEVLVEGMIDVATADGQLSPEERAALRRFGRQVGLFDEALGAL